MNYPDDKNPVLVCAAPPKRLSDGRFFVPYAVCLWWVRGWLWSRDPAEPSAFKLGVVSIAEMTSTNPARDKKWRARALWHEGQRPALSRQALAELRSIGQEMAKARLVGSGS